MTDIVERLQVRYHETAEPECELLREAADEIELLRAALEAARQRAGAMTGLDFWATDPDTDSKLPIFDAWSTTFCLQEWTREVMRDQILLSLKNIPKSNEVTP